MDEIFSLTSGTVGITTIREFETLPYLVLEVNEEALKELRDSDLVEFIQEDTPDSPTLLNSVPLIDADNVWNEQTEGQNRNVAILDTGVDSTHPFLRDKVVAEACFSSTSTLANEQPRSNSLCPNGNQTSREAGSAQPPNILGSEHGTHVAGIAAGAGGRLNMNSFDGVARRSNIFAIQVFSQFVDPDDCNNNAPCLRSYISDQLAALEEVFQRRNDDLAVISVNMSLGGSTFTTACDTDSRKNVIDELLRVGVSTVASAGNNGESNVISAPACISSVVSVGSTDNNDNVSNFSNSSAELDLLAPGERILSATSNSNYGQLSGTSMASPHVAGAIALLASGSSVSSSTIVEVLRDNGVQVTDSRNNITRPRIDLDNSLTALRTRADYCRIVGNLEEEKVMCRLAAADGSLTGANVSSPRRSEGFDWGYTYFREFADVNGDGRADYCRMVGNPEEEKVMCRLAAADGSLTGANVSSPRRSEGFDWGYTYFREFADVNGDGRADYCRMVGNPEEEKVMCRLAAADGSLTGANVSSPRRSEGFDWGYTSLRSLINVNKPA
ncbi:MAG: S8 family serine peptidase [Cyanothece sp. SIO1E1]|nr:S8 family serine peptidase [Cyanothece sp. SIO1E1]